MQDYLSVKDVASRYSVNPSTIWRWLKKGKFPKPKHFSTQLVRWSAADLERWEASNV